MISVVIPCFNEGESVWRTIDMLLRGECSREINEIIVVDDGSDVALDQSIPHELSEKITVVRQANLGRYRARQHGVRVAKGNIVLFLDSRVVPTERALCYLSGKLSSFDKSIWNSHVELPDDVPLVGRFWRAIEHIAWWNYYRDSRDLEISREDLDYYPVGTTMLAAKRDLLEKHFDLLEHQIDRPGRYTSDDTLLIRSLATEVNVRYSRQFSCVYQPRTTLKKFFLHAFHRGRVFHHGHLHRGSRYLGWWWLMLIGFLTFPALVIFSTLHGYSEWILGSLLGFLAVALVAFGFVRRRAPLRESIALFLYVVPFGVFFLSGTLVSVVMNLGRHQSEPVINP